MCFYAKSNGVTRDGKKGQMKTIKRKALEKTFSLSDSNRVERPQLWFLGFKPVLPKRMISLGGGAEDDRRKDSEFRFSFINLEMVIDDSWV